MGGAGPGAARDHRHRIARRRCCDAADQVQDPAAQPGTRGQRAEAAADGYFRRPRHSALRPVKAETPPRRLPRGRGGSMERSQLVWAVSDPFPAISV